MALVKAEIKDEDIPLEENDQECNHELIVEKVTETKEILKSTIDPDAGILYKDEKEKMVAYNTSIICDNNNYILSYDTNPSNMHDSKSFYPTYKKFKEIVMDDYRHSYDCKEVYKTRPEHVERIFADAKGKNGLRYTLFKGKRRVSSEIGLIFASMNLKKYATLLQKYEKEPKNIIGNSLLLSVFDDILDKIKNIIRNMNFGLYLSTV